ncbi:lactoylglutathione lyase family protein [Saccharomonospora marina XMU15]|uniref:Lactoylglutathione lyase family protein n=1 Tax=Saccharomonospora marina XMU15 TaxID=882083 RepID=H5XBG8_9PSEU|nr:VOC family protein [Saccharomonospora marina]EHR50475.1 lactoylglutathione lyase family protein [Saccharomonospora marina XMU15]
MTAPSNMVTWFQLPAADTRRAWGFYEEVFGWSAQRSHTAAPQLGAVHGEIAERSDELRHPRLVIRVDDLASSLRRITDAGGRVLVERTEIPAIGMAFATFVDTEGNQVNIVSDM